MSGSKMAGPRLPDFLVIGAMKAGTTSLHHYLSGHPEVFMPTIKELDFFTEELSWSRGWAWYARHFAAAAEAKAVGEASTSYTKYPRYKGVAERIAEHIPNARLIYVVRDPIERIRSHYQHNVAIGEERRPIEEAILANPVYLDYSRYAMQIERYLQFFDRERLLLLTSEELRHKRLETMRRVFEFIGVDRDAAIENIDEEFYRTEDRPAYGRTLGGVRRGLKKAFPRALWLWRGHLLPATVKRGLGRPVRSTEGLAGASIPSSIVQGVREALVDDVRRIRSYMGDQFDGWGMA